MMEFKRWLEVSDPKKPTDQVKRTNIIKDKGTNVARRVIQYAWTTKYGNVVSLQFEPKGNDEYSIIFYVNNVLYDYGSKLGLADKDATIDSEILSSVFYVLKQKANQLKAKVLTFHGHKSDKDTKIIRNIEIEPYRKQALSLIDEFIDEVQAYKVNIIPPSASKIATFAKIGKEVHPEPDLNKEIWLRFGEKMKKAVNGLSTDGETADEVERLVGELLNADHYKRLSMFNVKSLIDGLKMFMRAVLSNTERGFARTKNRRTAIYKNILNKYFSDEWDIQVSGDNFTLMKL